MPSDFGRVLGVGGHEGVQLADALQSLRYPPLGQHRAGLVDDTDVVVGLGPVVPDVDRLLSFSPLDLPNEPKESSGALMDQCSRHAIPPAVRGVPRLPAGARFRPRARGSASSSTLPLAGSATV